MPSAIPNQKTVLFVDDDAQFLELLQPTMERLSRGEWNVMVGADSAAALSAIGSHTVDLIVLDVQMPIVDGVQLLNLIHRKQPQLRKAVLSGHIDEACRAAAFTGGAELVLQKPLDAAGYAALFAALNEMLHLQAEQGFRGTLRRVGLEDIIQMECLSRHSLILEVTTRGKRGRIFIRDGALIHAEFGTATGEPALQELLSLSGGEFHHRAFVAPARETLEGSFEFLLMEAMRKRDESAGGVAEEESGEAAPEVPESTPPSHAPPPPRAVAAPVINELVVCSQQGEPLYAAQSPNAHERCALCVALMEAGARLHALLPLGALERVEFVSVSGRMIARLQDGHAIFLRASDQ